MPEYGCRQPANLLLTLVNAQGGNSIVWTSVACMSAMLPVPPFALNETVTSTPQSSLQSGSVQTLCRTNGTTLPLPSVANPAAPATFACAAVSSTALNELPF